MTSKAKARFGRSTLPRPTSCSKCGSVTHVSLVCPRDRKPLERSGRVNPKREEPRRSSRERDDARLAFLRTDTCGVALILGSTVTCAGPIDAEHERMGVGMGQKADASRTWSCCRRHHTELHSLTGFFRFADRDYIRRFRDERIRASSERYARHLLAQGA